MANNKPRAFTPGQTGKAEQHDTASSNEVNNHSLPTERSASDSGEGVDPEQPPRSSEASKPSIGQGDFEAVMGRDLARMMQKEGYHPVILYGTTYSGKTSLLLSLFAILRTQADRLRTGLVLKESLFEVDNDASRSLHDNARKTFEILVPSFMAGEQIPSTKSPLPFFIPVEFRPPDGRPPIRFAFMESNGEWYSSKRERGQKYSDLETLFPEFQKSTEAFISNFSKGINFLYLAPLTQGKMYEKSEPARDAFELTKASEALAGVLRAYERLRINGRSEDRHNILVTKWDKRAEGLADRAGAIEEDLGEVEEFFAKEYNDAWYEFDSIGVPREQKGLNAYCSGIMKAEGLYTVSPDDEAAEVINSYPIRLWAKLYRDALSVRGSAEINPFPPPPAPNPILAFIQNVLDKVSGN